jgi:cytochrome c oxidase assembly factor CtaG
MRRWLFICLFILPTVAWAHPSVNIEHTNNPWLQVAADYWVTLPLMIVLLAYLVGALSMQKKHKQLSRNTKKRLGLFLGGWLCMVIALLSPVDSLGNTYFSMHMVQHELLMIVAAPLLVLSRPLALWAWAAPKPNVVFFTTITTNKCFSTFWRYLTHPFSAWTVHAIALWGWHVPYMFENALHRSWLHDIQHISFFFSALLFWWSLLRVSNANNSTILPIISLFTTALHTALLGALLTFSSQVWYPSYIITTGGVELALKDQQLGGLIMWIPGGVPYLVITLLLCYKLLNKTHAIPQGLQTTK